MIFFNKMNSAETYTLAVYVILSFIFPALMCVLFSYVIFFENGFFLLFFLQPVVLFPVLIVIDRIAKYIYDHSPIIKSISCFNRYLMATNVLIAGTIVEWIYFNIPFSIVRKFESLGDFVVLFICIIAFLLFVECIVLGVMGRLRARKIILNPSFRE